MISGRAIIKEKGVKHVKGNIFEVTLTGVVPDSPLELLAMTGTEIEFEMYKTEQFEERKTPRRQPENGRLFKTDGSGIVVEMGSAKGEPAPVIVESGSWECGCGYNAGETEPENKICPKCGGLIFFTPQPTDNESGTSPEGGEGSETTSVWICDKCQLHIGELENPEDTKCPECKEGNLVRVESEEQVTESDVEIPSPENPEAEKEGVWICSSCGTQTGKEPEDGKCIACEGEMKLHGPTGLEEYPKAAGQ